VTTRKQSEYDPIQEYAKIYSISSLGLMSNKTWLTDPKRLVFTLSRYKFVSKMFEGQDKVLEIGCGDAWASKIVRQSVNSIYFLDADEVLLNSARVSHPDLSNKNFILHDVTTGPIGDTFDAIFLLDVLEHVEPENEKKFMSSLYSMLRRNGVAIIGMPSLESQTYASEASKAGHVNCKSGQQFLTDMKQWFSNVFIFSMNDEVVHTGYSKMAHYLITLCIK
jgi:2-polyprenyl-3-methyl-5-hydroxy-6-metoxy-1,4-benzoquinol methylase